MSDKNLGVALVVGAAIFGAVYLLDQRPAAAPVSVPTSPIMETVSYPAPGGQLVYPGGSPSGIPHVPVAAQ